MLDSHIIAWERSDRLRFSARHTPDRGEFYNSDEFRRHGHVQWSPASYREADIIGVFHTLRAIEQIYAHTTHKPKSEKVLADSLTAACAILRMNMRFDAWTSMEVSDGYETRIGFFFRRAEDALMFKMVWPS